MTSTRLIPRAYGLPGLIGFGFSSMGLGSIGGLMGYVLIGSRVIGFGVIRSLGCGYTRLIGSGCIGPMFIGFGYIGSRFI